jgi:hypothetical protein
VVLGVQVLPSQYLTSIAQLVVVCPAGFQVKGKVAAVPVHEAPSGIALLPIVGTGVFVLLQHFSSIYFSAGQLPEPSVKLESKPLQFDPAVGTQDCPTVSAQV